MALPRRDHDDVFLPDGTFGGMITTRRRNPVGHDLRIGIVYASDNDKHGAFFIDSEDVEAPYAPATR